MASPNGQPCVKLRQHLRAITPGGLLGGADRLIYSESTSTEGDVGPDFVGGMLGGATTRTVTQGLVHKDRVEVYG